MDGWGSDKSTEEDLGARRGDDYTAVVLGAWKNGKPDGDDRWRWGRRNLGLFFSRFAYDGVCDCQLALLYKS